MPHYPYSTLASDRSVLVCFGEEISETVHLNVWRAATLFHNQSLPSIINIHPAYCSVLIDFDPLQAEPAQVLAWCDQLLAHLQDISVPPQRLVEIPVVYGGEFGPDLHDVAAFHSLSVEDVIKLHVSSEYLVYFLGFSPGFAYMGGLPAELATPRLESPRQRVPAGSVAIAGNQTGIYPIETPGGWRIIGRTPLTLFDPERNPPTLLSVGDRVRFKQIATEQFPL
jgi:KipI family sensor histidine kinase inhibitor